MDYQKLYRHMAIEHGLFLLDSQMQEIVSVVLEMDDQKLFNHMYDEHDLLLLQSQKQEIVDIVLEMHNEKPENCTASIERQYKEKGNQLDQVYGAIKDPSNKSAVGIAKIADSVADSRKIEKMKTAMQEMLQWIRETLPMDLDYPRMIEEKVESLLEKEKEQMKDAFVEGSLSWATGTNSEHYYNETYGEKK